MKRDFNKKISEEITLFFFLSILFTFSGCKKLVHVDPPINSITTPQIFNTDIKAMAALSGIYSNLINSGTQLKFGSGTVSLYCGLSADEMKFYFNSGGEYEFNANSLLPNNSIISSQFWTPAYFAIYEANASIEGLKESEAISSKVKSQLIGEAKFTRAFCYFYLVNLFGDVPLLQSSNWSQNYLASRATTSDIYKQITADLTDAQDLLINDYSYSNNERIRPNKWAAAALLARVYLFLGDWANAEKEASDVLNNSSLYSLEKDLNKVYLANNSEAIWQLQPSAQTFPFAVPESYFIQFNAPLYYLTDNLLSSFENGDQRKSDWITVVSDGINNFNCPYKYKVMQGSSGGGVTEYYTVLRLAEQYLIRAEARANQNNTLGALYDLNLVRARAGLLGLSNTLSQQQLIDTIEHENRIEFFSEWGHRWLDLKRLKKTDLELKPLKGSTWQSSDQLYPIPIMEIQHDPNLKQNLGY